MLTRISGVALQIHWADIEPTEGNPDWTKLYSLFAAREVHRCLEADVQRLNDSRLSINAGLVPNANGQVVNYLEIYEPDIVNSIMQQVLHDGHQQLLKSPSP